MFCPKCGNKNADTTNFCAFCGTPLKQPAAAPVKESAELSAACMNGLDSEQAVAAPAEPVVQAPKAKEEEKQKDPSKKGSKGRKIFLICLCALLVLGGTAAALIFTHVICLFHEFSDATCSAPKTCIYCEKTEGAPLGHDWSDATCVVPKFCYTCSLTEGEPLGHVWKEADCENPRTCTVCGEKTGESLGHDWIAATCTDPQRCATCDAVGESALGHSLSDWTTVQEATLSHSGTQTRSCTVCNTVTDERTIDKKLPSVTGSAFNFADEEFLLWLNEVTLATVYGEEVSSGELGNSITAYNISLNAAEGLLILDHGDNGLKGNVCAVMVHFEQADFSALFATTIASLINPAFEIEAAATALTAGASYRDSELTIAPMQLTDALSVSQIAPNTYFTEVYGEN